MVCKYCGTAHGFGHEPNCKQPKGDFYDGIEWFACWLLDNVEGQEILEEQLGPWAVEAWNAWKTRQAIGKENDNET